MKKIFITLFFIQILFSCSYGKIVILTDPWWNDSYELEREIQKELFSQLFKTGKRIKNVSVETEEEVLNIINEMAGIGNSSVIIATPIFYSLIRKISAEEKFINYIIINGYYDSSADNIIAVYSFREEVYFQAGIKAAEFSVENNNCTVSSVFYNGSLSRKLEKESFVKGYESIKESGKLEIYEQKTYTGGEKLKNFINSAPENGTGLFFFSASSLNPFCFDIAAPLSIAVSGENLNSLGIYNELIEFSIDDDMMEIVKTALKKGIDGEFNDDIPINAVITEKGINF